MARSPSRSSGSRIVSRDAVRRGSPVQFFKETVAELRKSIWPTREETFRLTYIVILLSAAVGALLSGMDFGFTQTFGKYIIR